MTSKKKRIIHSSEFKAETLKLTRKSEALQQQDISRYMNLRSTTGESHKEKSQY